MNPSDEKTDVVVDTDGTDEQARLLTSSLTTKHRKAPAMPSNLEAMASNLLAMASNLRAMAFDLLDPFVDHQI